MKRKISTLLLSIALASVASAQYYTEGGKFVSSKNGSGTLSFQNVADNYQGTDVTPVTFSFEVQDGSYIAKFNNDFEFKGDVIVENNNKNTWFQSAFLAYSTTGATVTFNNISNTIVTTQTAAEAKITRYAFKGLGENLVKVIFNKMPVYPANGMLWLEAADLTIKVNGKQNDVWAYSGSVVRAMGANVELNTMQLRGGNVADVCTYKGNTQFDIGSLKGVRVDAGVAVNGGSLVATMGSHNMGNYENDRSEYAHVMTVVYESDVAESVTLKSLNTVFKTTTKGHLDFVDITSMGLGDQFCSELDLTSDAYASKIFINNKNILEYSAEELGITKNGTLNVYTMNIPEPSTYAMIFGALALAFALYRRRK